MIPRYSPPEIAGIWSEENKFAAWLKVETAALRARAEAGEIPPEVPDEVERSAKFSIERIDELEREFHHDVVAFITNVGEHIGDNSQYFHQGMTSSDVLDTALALQLKQASQLILGKIDYLLKVLKTQAVKYKHVQTAGRTHGVHAETTTFGLKLANFYAEVYRGRGRFTEAASQVEIGKLSGAVGTYPLMPPSIEKRTMEILGLQPDTISNQIVQRDRHAFYLAAIAVLGGTLERIALEIRHLSRTEVGEALEPFGKKQRGSSAMPHKKNPITCERICGLARILRADALAGMENQALWHERDISHSSVERVILPDSTILIYYMLDRTIYVLEGMAVFPEKMADNLEITGGLIHSQKILNLLLDKGFTRDSAYNIVQRCAMAARERGLSFSQSLEEDDEAKKMISSEDIQRAFKADLPHVNEIFRRLGLD
ncbi:adenylosuccinate lyase [bacterium]|nr:adenylosuccinate lyase [FCB group bacterium]MBL7190648.1 adenylosuccinate lyase [bacterium]